MAKPKIALASPNQNAISETFIHAHRDCLPFDVDYLHSGFSPLYSEKNGYIGLSQWQLKKSFPFIGKVNLPLHASYDDVLTAYIKRHGIRLILAEYGLTGAEMMPACQKAGIPLIVHFHGFDAARRDMIAPYLDRYKDMFAYASSIISVSRDMTEKLIALGADPSKIILNPYGPHEKFRVSKKERLSRQPYIFLATGRFVGKKAPHLVIEAFHLAAERNPDIRLVMIGEGPLLEQSIQLVRSYDLGNKVIFLGKQDHDRVLAEMQKADCFVQHSIVDGNGDSEGTPVAILEAGLAGLPVISTRHAGIKDVVIEGKTGILVNERDITAMSEAMIDLAQNPPKGFDMGQCATHHISQNFSLQKHLDILTRAIQDALGDSHV
ncbi:MAG TPA: glycosyltransferase [Alphaproteobacteria bacterium]